MLVDVILRSPANSGTTKNLEILRGACPACPGHSPGEPVEGLRMILVISGWTLINKNMVTGNCESGP